jgi:hypothetical protein
MHLYLSSSSVKHCLISDGIGAFADRDHVYDTISIESKGTGCGQFMIKSVSWLITCLKRIIRDLLR